MAEIESAVAFGRESEQPDMATMLGSVYAPHADHTEPGAVGGLVGYEVEGPAFRGPDGVRRLDLGVLGGGEEREGEEEGDHAGAWCSQRALTATHSVLCVPPVLIRCCVTCPCEAGSGSSGSIYASLCLAPRAPP